MLLGKINCLLLKPRSDLSHNLPVLCQFFYRESILLEVSVEVGAAISGRIKDEAAFVNRDVAPNLCQFIAVLEVVLVVVDLNSLRIHVVKINYTSPIQRLFFALPLSLSNVDFIIAVCTF